MTVSNILAVRDSAESEQQPEGEVLLGIRKDCGREAQRVKAMSEGSKSMLWHQPGRTDQHTPSDEDQGDSDHASHEDCSLTTGLPSLSSLFPAGTWPRFLRIYPSHLFSF